MTEDDLLSGVPEDIYDNPWVRDAITLLKQLSTERARADKAEAALLAERAQVLADLKAASAARYEEMKTWDSESEKCTSEDDGYGYNFFKGMHSGANWVDIFYQRIGRSLEARAKDIDKAMKGEK